MKRNNDEDKCPLYLRIAEKILDVATNALVFVDKKMFPEDYERKPLTYKENQKLQKIELERKRKEEDKRNAEEQRQRLEKLKKEVEPFYKRAADMKKVDKELRKKYGLRDDEKIGK